MDYKRHSLITAMLYFMMTGCCCLLVGSSLTQLMDLYQLPLNKVVILGSVFAIGRVVIVNFSGNICKEKGSRFCVIAGALCFAVYLFGIGLIHNYYLAYLLCFIGGCGQGLQDTVTPILLAKASKEDYSANMSIGQALFDAGCFIAPLLIGVMLKVNIPFYFSYFVMGIMALCVFFMGLRLKDEKDEEQEEEIVTPMYVNNPYRTVIFAFIFIFFNSSLFGVYCTYITSFGIHMGLSEADSSFLLSLFNIGAMFGSFAFAPVLKKVKEIDVMIFNTSVSAVLLGIVLYVKNISLYYILFPAIGFMLGVIFGVAISIVTRICFKDIGEVTPKLGLMSGMADVSTPVFTGYIISRMGIMFSMEYIMFANIICILMGILIKKDIVKE
ncbi:MAG: MFS transporter [Erysipelotrichaceae bacterium]|nr:MFS transporter [Erysipelotrichaceae bacterium]